MTHQPTAWSIWLTEALRDLEGAKLARSLHPLTAQDAVHVNLGGRPVTLFSSNDYLGLSKHPKVVRRFIEAAERCGLGPRGSPLICGYTDEHEALEQSLADLKGTEAALLFPSGFAANTAVIASLCDDETAVFSDELNHASIIDGCSLGKRRGATSFIYRHKDLNHLSELLRASNASRKLIISDAVFSMDGDLADLQGLVSVKREADAMLMIDEAHATLVFGANGAGLCNEQGVSEDVEIQMGTMSKAFGAQGGFVATSKDIKRWLLNRGRPYVFSTALPVPVVAACKAAIDVVRTEPKIRSTLWQHIETLNQALDVPVQSPIFPIILGSEERALQASALLLEDGIHATAIRPPTVPHGTCRLRITVSAAHTEQDVAGLIKAIERLKQF